MSTQNDYREELSDLRLHHNYKTFMILAIILFASCGIFLLQKLYLPDRNTSALYTARYVRLYLSALIFAPLFMAGSWFARKKHLKKLVSAAALLFCLFVVTLGLSLTLLDFHDYQNLTAVYIATIGVSIMLSAPYRWYALIILYLTALFCIVYVMFLQETANQSLIISIAFLGGLSAALGMYTERSRTQNQVARLRMRDMMLRDHLTGVYNRIFLHEYINRMLETKHRYNTDISCLLIDVDHFKDINDTRGHQTGDRVLSALTRCLQEQIRQSDIIARMGGEEFLIVLPQTSLRNASRVAEKVRAAVERADLEGVKITISIGVGEFRESEQFESLYHRIDEALYRAKKGGRNRYEVSGN